MRVNDVSVRTVVLPSPRSLKGGGYINNGLLSNFASCPWIAVQNERFTSVECAYVYLKSPSPDLAQALNFSPAKAKQLGRDVVLAADWESIKIAAMAFCLQQKFSQPKFRSWLLAQQPSSLVEWTNWGRGGDQIWGVYVRQNVTGQACPGRNILGRLAQRMRSMILEDNDPSIPAERSSWKIAQDRLIEDINRQTE
jgi:predicted NAD-dependent protein-ADP-ribosyltransferase YbiA (DUF1768 family)